MAASICLAPEIEQRLDSTSRRRDAFSISWTSASTDWKIRAAQARHRRPIWWLLALPGGRLPGDL